MSLAAAVTRLSRKPAQRPMVLGHRGARADAPENTLKAFDEAMRQGADGVELDVRSSADGEMFIAHDDLVPLRSGSLANLADLSRSQIEKLSPASGEPIAFLDDVLRWKKSSGAVVNIEIKGNLRAPLRLARSAAALLSTAEPDGLILSSFHPLVVAKLVKLLPFLPVGLLFDADQVRAKRVVPYRLLGAHAVHPQDASVTAASVQRDKSRGALVNVWTVNDPERACQLSRYGVDAIITDVPGLILARLQTSEA